MNEKAKTSLKRYVGAILPIVLLNLAPISMSWCQEAAGLVRLKMLDQPLAVALEENIFKSQGSLLDWSSEIDGDRWGPRVSRGEDGGYWAVCQRQDGNHKLEIYRAKGDPASAAWLSVWVIDDVENLRYQDIEVVTSADRGFVLYMRETTFEVRCFWFQLSDPTINGDVYLGPAFEGGFLSLASDEVTYDDDSVYVYASWKHIPSGSPTALLQFSRTTDLGLTWCPPQTTYQGVEFMYTGNAITYCPSNEIVQILFTDEANSDVILAYSALPRGDPAGGWFAYVMLSHPTLGYTSGGVTSMYGGYLLATAHRANPPNGLDVFFRYSSSGGGPNWGTSYYYWPRAGNQVFPSCTSNNDGYFSMMYYTEDLLQMESRVALYSGLPSSWTTGTVDDIQPFAGINSACMQDGSDPNHGGTWSDGTGPGATSFFGWAGSESHGMRITLTPVTSVIVPQGSSFSYEVVIENTSASSQTFDIWVNATKPNGQLTGNLIGPFLSVTKPAGWTFLTTRTQAIPTMAPLGHYSMNGYIGIYPNDIWVCDNFNFEVVPPPDGINTKIGGTVACDWLHSREALFEDEQANRSSADDRASIKCAPSPFNPTTTIRYQLSASIPVTLTVHDISGREVARLVDGWRDAGNHQVTFDGSSLSSGMYFYKFTAGEYEASGKMVLMK